MTEIELKVIAIRDREATIRDELRAIVALQQVRLGQEIELRAEENARERELRDELQALHAGEPLDLFAGVEIES